jgi:hypothetical protein
MKTFKLIGMALIAILLGVSVSACSSDNDEDNNGTTSIVSNGKKISSITYSSAYYGTTSYYFKYEQGYLSEVSCSTSDWEYPIRYTWNDNEIIATDNSGDKYIISLSSNRIKSLEDIENKRIYYLTYDSNGYLSSTTYDKDSYTFYWNNGDMTKSTWLYYDHGNNTYTFNLSYNNDVDFTGLNYLLPSDCFDNPFYSALDNDYALNLVAAHPNLLGNSSKAAYSHVVSNVSSSDVTYDYSYDSTSYPTKIIEQADWANSPTTITVTWE